MNERWYGIDTRTQGEDSGVAGAERYVPSGYRVLRRTARVLRPHVLEDDVLYDVGCGKGRVLAVMARLPLARLVAIELDPRLADLAHANLARSRWRRAGTEVICASVLDVDLDDETIFYLYYPFGEETVTVLVQRLSDSLARHPRRIIVVYHHADHAAVFDETDGLKRFGSFMAPDGPVIFWRARSLT